MKKLLSLALVLALAACSLASCGDDSKETTGADSKADTTVAGTTASGDDSTAAPDNDTTAPDADTTAPDNGENTTAAPTTPSTPATGKELYKFDFTDEDVCDEWVLGQTGTAADAYYDKEENCYIIEIVADDAQIQIDSMDEDIDVEEIKSITIEVKNATNDTKGQIFFFVDGSGPSEACSVFYDYQNSGENAEWETVTITFGDDVDLTPWSGFLTGFRFDISDHGTDGYVYLRSLTING